MIEKGEQITLYYGEDFFKEATKVAKKEEYGDEGGVRHNEYGGGGVDGTAGGGGGGDGVDARGGGRSRRQYWSGGYNWPS